MKWIRVLLLFFGLTIFAQSSLCMVDAYSLDEEETREANKVKNAFFADTEVFYESLGLIESQTPSSFLALPSPPSGTESYQLRYFSESATVWCWNEGTTLHIHAQPSGSFFLCGPQFSVIQNNIQYGDIKLETEGGDSFCEDLFIAQTFYFTQWSFVSTRFISTQPLTIVFDGGSAGNQFIDYNPNTETSSSTTTTTPQATTTTPTSSTTSISSGPCPSETIYGKDSYEVRLLRSIRENVLNKSPEGQELIKLYYQWSPYIVRIMEADEEFKQEIKDIIDEILPMISQ